MRRLVALLACSAFLSGAAAEAATLLQAASARRGLQLELSEGRAWLVRPGGQRLRLPLRRTETLERMVEFENGWAAAGTRAREGRRQLVVLVDGAAGVERLRPVPEPIPTHRVRPVPMASDSGFGGVAWLEGDSPTDHRVRVADWSGADWSPPLTVSAARRGGQAGLVGTVLEDDRWLLVWSASDGGASELFWSLRENGRWSPPRRLTAPNRVPDITPALLRVPGGALAVWARRGPGGYRLRAARFTGSWSAPRSLGPVGAAFPRLAELPDVGRFVIARSTGGWTTLELDAAGSELRRAVIAEPRPEHPILTAAGGGLSLRWERTGPARSVVWGRRP